MNTAKSLWCILSIVAATGTLACESNPLIHIDGTVRDTLAQPPRLPSVEVPLRNRIALVSDAQYPRADLFLISRDGTNLIPLTSDSAANSCPSISPDGRKIAYQRDGSIYTMNADRTENRLVMASPDALGIHFQCAVWSPDSRKLTFISVNPRIKSPSPTSLYTAGADGKALTVVKTGINFSRVEWSPDGLKLLLGSNSYTDGGPYDFKVSVLDLAGAVVAQVPGGRVPTDDLLTCTGRRGRPAFRCDRRRA